MPAGETSAEVSAGRFFPLWGWAFPAWIPPWLVIVIAPLAGVLLGAGLLALFRSSPIPSEPTGPQPEEPAQTVQGPVSPGAVAETPGLSKQISPPLPKEPPKHLDKQWIPDPVGLVVAVRWNRLADQGRLQETLEYFSPGAVEVGRRLLKHLRLGAEKVEHLIWLAVDGSDWPNQSVILVGLAEDGLLGELSQRGQPCGFRVADADCRKESGAAWPHPWALVASRWILTGPEVLLRHLSERPKPQLSSRALDRMLDNWPWKADLAVGVDAARFRPLVSSRVQRLVAVWPEARRPVQILWELSEGFFTGVYFGEPARYEIALWCRTVSEAEQVRAAGEELLGAGGTGLSGRLQRLATEVQAGQWKADQAAAYDTLLKLLQAGVQSARLELAETVLWARTAWKQSWQEMLESWKAGQQALERDWEEALAGLIQQQEHRLLQALAAYAKAEGHFPPGAEGGPLWDPATRLSWIALVLPYLGRADWYGQLQLRYAWNSPQNKAVAQRPLEEVLNPAIPQRATEAGFPVTHYVGVGGLGEDAVQPQADQRRIGVFGFGRTLKPEEITDGLSHTIAIAGATSRLGPWASGGSATVRPFTQPPYVNGPDGFGTGQPDGMFVGMADGSVRFISKEIDPRVLEMLVTARGMERIEGLAWETGPKEIRPGHTPAGPSAKVPETKPPAPAGPSEIAKTPPKGRPTEPTETKSPPGGPQPKQAEAKPASEAPSEKPPAVAEKTAPEKEKSPAVAEKTAPEKEKPLPSKAEQQAQIEARLAEKVASIELPAVPLRKAVNLLEALGGVRITYDLEEMALAGVSLETPVRLKQTDLSVGEILRQILEPMGLVYLVEGEDVVISRPPAARQHWHTVRYDVSDLTDCEENSPEQIAKLVERFVLPESWLASGGKGKIEVQDEVFLVHQTDLGHRQVTDLLEKLRLARGLPLRIDPSRKDLSLQTRLTQMRPVLDRGVTANFGSPTPLPEILSYLEQLGQVAIVVDWVSVRAEGHPASLSGTLRVHQQPLAQALSQLLEPLGLTWRIASPGLIQVTTQKTAGMELELEFYPCSEPIAALGSPQAVLEAIKDHVGRTAWEDGQGPGAIYFDPPSKYLIVLQTPAVHRALERFLSSLRPPKPTPAGKSSG